MERTNEINNFIKWFAKVYEQNPNVLITSDSIYDALKNYDFSQEEINNKDAKDVVERLEEYYSKSKRLNVYVDLRQTSFLQFRSYNVSEFDSNCVKLYVSVPKEKYEETAKIIFDYIEKKKIKSLSKISKNVRSDSIVLRLPNSKEAKQVIDFINKNEKITKFARKTNPFLYREGIVGVVFDRMLSYNSVVSELVQKYLQNLKNQNSLNNASYQDFKNYIKEFYQSCFRNCDKIGNVDSFSILRRQHKSFDTKGEGIYNLENVIRLILNNIEDNYNLDSYFRYFDSVIDKDNIESFSKYYSEMYNKKDLFNHNILPKERRNDAIIIENPKYKNYIENTKEDYKKIFANDVNINPLPKERRNDAIMISDLYVENKSNENNQSFSNQNNSNPYLIFYNAALETLKKYGVEQLKLALNKASEGKYESFTNFNNSRNNLVKYVNPSFIGLYCRYYLNSVGITEINDLIPQFVDTLNKLENNKTNSVRY